MTEPRTAAATRARRKQYMQREIRKAVIFLRGNGYTVTPNSLDAALILQVQPAREGVTVR